ncbi:hypothetical protein NLI96_g10590 [Meripilus lineatus]|uniref:Uncharacterized protein n=1 Tax=Meripilus lineatus TaxID=2056292 RepID=A0AAD5UVQ4_9APHY|nr:hypothetical protein NLI96_g10590 [Physisporinus lineatus]
MPVRSSFNPPQGHSPILFPTLEILHLDPENFGDVLPFIRWVRLPQLRDFRVFNKTAFSNGSHLEELLSHLSAFKLLSDVTILAIPNIFGPSPLNTLTATSFAPLLDLHSLSVLDVNPNMAIDLDDDVLAAMATAWPRIKVLSIVPSLELPTKPRATLGALIPLVTQCPLLCSVALPLDLLIPEKYIRCDMRTYRSNRKWAAFDIWYWSDVVADNWIMADFLCELLPTVHNAFSVRRVGFAKPYFKSWLLFQRYVKLFGGYQEKPRPSSVLSEP